MEKRDVYLDNAATSHPKPECVLTAMRAALTDFNANPGRSGHRRSLEAARAVLAAREAVAAVLGARDPFCVAFAFNCTDALNLAIKGALRTGDHVISTLLEHNSVLRVLAEKLRREEIELTLLTPRADGFIDPEDVRGALRKNTRLIAVTHASNVTGAIQPVAAIAQVAREAGVPFLVDGAQALGSMPVDVNALGCQLYAFPGHKGLLGPQGTGGMAVAEGIDVQPWAEGGSGVHSFERRHPLEWPTRLEAGTLNAHGLAGLSAGVAFIEKKGGSAAVGAREHALARRLYEGVVDVPGVTVYGGWVVAPERCGSIVALNVDGLDSAEVADALASGWGIACRAGAHCAPLMHRALGTERQGIVRLSCGWFNTEEEIDVAAAAVREIAAS